MMKLSDIKPCAECGNSHVDITSVLEPCGTKGYLVVMRCAICTYGGGGEDESVDKAFDKAVREWNGEVADETSND